MVSKVAVIALVAIVAVPIMLGYAMNLEQVTETDYKVSGDSVNVTPLLQQDIGYTYTHTSSYDLNSNFVDSTGNKVMPIYEITNTKSSLQVSKSIYNGSHPAWGGTLETWVYRYYQNIYSGSGGYLIGNLIDDNGVTIQTIERLQSYYYDRETLTITYTYYTPSFQSIFAGPVINLPNDRYIFSLTDSGGYNSSGYAEYIIETNSPEYANISEGYTFQLVPRNGTPFYYPVKPSLPQYTRSILFTIDLSSLTDANTVFRIGQLIMTKTTTDDIVHWTVTNELGDIEPFEIYYDNSTTNNTYQIKITADPASRRSAGSGLSGYDLDYNLRYVGAWPISIGEANYYQEYEASTIIVMPGELDLNNQITLGSTSLVTPTMRIDDAEYRAFEYPIIINQTYAPADFKSNPTTTISNITQYGTELSFGGNTYTVSNGSITLGSHQVPVKDLVLSSIPNPSGGYDNKIGNTVVSTTADPSTITFGGQWSASISTTAQEEYEYTKTEWIAGGFAWDGIDQNFLMVGLITCLGVFVALGIYARRSGARVLPLMIVCGGAALLFFVML